MYRLQLRIINTRNGIFHEPEGQFFILFFVKKYVSIKNEHVSIGSTILLYDSEMCHSAFLYINIKNLNGFSPNSNKDRFYA